jgi:hypothetical protein
MRFELRCAAARVVGVAALVCCLLSGCSKPVAELRAQDAAVAPPTSYPPTSPARAPSTLTKRSQGQAAKGTSAPSPKPAPGAPVAATEPPSAKVADDELKVEEPEANPYSETVTLRLTVTPQAKALVMWGGKQVAKLGPGSMDAEIVRPRGSGPVDLEIKAEGYLPYHTRLYSDRSEKLNARLYRPEEAPSLFGYKRPTNPTEKKK